MRPPAWLLAAMTALWIVATPVAAAERSLDKQVELPATLDQVWDAWTTREGITSFFAPEAQIEPKVGGAFHIYIDPLAAPGGKGADDMRYMALQPKKMLSFDWNAPPSLPEVRAQRTVVILRFEPIGEQRTRLSLHHLGWGDGGEWDKAYTYFDKAWDHVLGNLHTRFESGRPQDWTAWLEQLRKWHDQPPPAKP